MIYLMMLSFFAITFLTVKTKKEEDYEEPTLQDYWDFLLPLEALGLDINNRPIFDYDGNKTYYQYGDPEGHLTIGLGHLIVPPEYYENGLKGYQIKQLFEKDIKRFVDNINKKLPYKMLKNQKIALVSFAFNIGNGGFNKSNLYNKVLKPVFQNKTVVIDDYLNSRIKEGFLGWTSKGLLTERRISEYEKFIA